jgi:hypothetical protein
VAALGGASCVKRAGAQTGCGAIGRACCQSSTPCAAGGNCVGGTCVTSASRATIDDLKITFRTNDEDKDGDTKVTVSIKGPPIWSPPKGRLHTRFDLAPVITGWSQAGDQHYDDQSTHTFALTPSSVAVEAVAGDHRLIVCINPNGNDTWRFNVLLQGTVSDGTPYRFEKKALQLDQERRCIEWDFGTGLLPFDVADGPRDANGFPLNARWGKQVPDINRIPDPLGDCRGLGTDNMSACSSVFSGTDGPGVGYDVLRLLDPDICRAGGPSGFNGHANFVVATYEGKVTFIDHKDFTDFGDDDYAFYLEPRDRGGVTTANGKRDQFGEGIEIEFDASDTIDLFNSAWWNDFHQIVDDDQPNASSVFPERSDAIVTGLLDLDCGERCKSELHPIYAMAVRVKEFQVGDALDEVWAIFARNFGDEGGCGSSQHEINLPGFIFTLPWRPGATGVMPGELTEFETFPVAGEAPTIWVAAGKSVMIAFHLSAARASGSNWRFVDGALHLLWQGPVTSPARRARLAAGVLRPAGAPALPASTPAVPVATEAKPIPRAFAALSIDDRRALRASQRATLPSKAGVKLPPPRMIARAAAPREVAGAPAHPIAVPFRPRIVPVKAAPDPGRLQRIEMVRAALCKANHDKVPGAAPNFCGGAAPTCPAGQAPCRCPSRPTTCLAPPVCARTCPELRGRHPLP